jgi:cell division protein FtsB
METSDIISIKQFCSLYNIPITFINSLNEIDLIEVVTIKKTQFIQKSHIKNIEKLMRIHFDLNINMEGIDVVYNLLQQIETLQKENANLNNKLKFYESF